MAAAMNDFLRTSCARPYPPRFRGTIRVTVAYGMMLVAIGAVRLGWGLLADHKFAKEVDNLRAAGFILLPEDYQLPRFDSEENAGYWLEQSLTLLPVEQLNRRFYGSRRASRVLRSRWPDDPQPAEHLDAFSAAMGEMISCRSGHWPDIGTPEKLAAVAASEYTANIDRARRALGLLAMNSHLMGDERGAVEHIRQLNRVAQLLATPGTEPTFCSRSISFEESAIALVRDTLPWLAMAATNDESSAYATPADRETIAGLIDDWLGPDHLERFRQQLAGYCRYEIAFVMQDRTPRPRDFLYTSHVPEPKWSLLRPLYVEHRMQSLRWYAAILEAASMATYEESVAHLKKRADWYYQMYQWNRSQSSLWGSLGLRAPNGFDLLLGLHEQSARRKLAGTALAIRMFAWDHGRWPDSVAELVDPEVGRYLPHLPIDPFADGVATLQYLPVASQRGYPPPRIYSFGRDCQDSGGRERQWRQASGDIVFSLAGNSDARPITLR